MDRRKFLSGLGLLLLGGAGFLKQTFARQPRSGPTEPSWSYRTTRDGDLVWKCLGPAQPGAMKVDYRALLDVNVYPRPAADLTKSPREMCVHDPAGVLLTCDICGPRPLSDGVFVE